MLVACENNAPHRRIPRATPHTATAST